jgi:hypothetical protein
MSSAVRTEIDAFLAKLPADTTLRGIVTGADVQKAVDAYEKAGRR